MLAALVSLSLLGTFVSTRAQTLSPGFHVVPRQLVRDLLENEDTDGDRKITIHDPYVRGTKRGDKVFWFTTIEGERCEVAGTSSLANLLQELTLLQEQAMDSAWVTVGRFPGCSFRATVFQCGARCRAGEGTLRRLARLEMT